MQHAGTAWDSGEKSQKAVRVDIDVKSYLARYFDPAKPACNGALKIGSTGCLNQKPPPMPAAKDGQRRRGGSKDFNFRDTRRRAGEPARHIVNLTLVDSGQDQCREPSEWRQAQTLALLRLGRKKTIAVPIHQGLHHWVLGHVGLEQDAARSSRPAGAAGHLVKQLIGALGRAQVTARKPEIRIDHANQGQQWKMMPLSYNLRSDQQVDLLGRHALDEGGSAFGPGNRVAGDNLYSGIGEQRRRLLGDTLDARPAYRETVLVLTCGADLRRPHREAAMVTL